MIPKSAQQALPIWNEGAWLGILLLPLSWVFVACVRLRRWAYRISLVKSQHLPVPVVVVGNITVGGTGKTPLVIYIAGLLKNAGYKPGIISRGYGGKAPSWPQWVSPDSDVTLVGDEAMLIATQVDCPMAVGPSRIAAAQLLLNQTDCDVILSDDGLQHYALARDIEIAVIDGDRRFGNGFCLPAGPLREPISRLHRVDLLVCNGKNAKAHEFAMLLTGSVAINVHTGEKKSLSSFKGTACHALAGIGNPERFFSSLVSAGLTCIPHRFPDHYAYSEHDISFQDDKPVLMTEKDAVKCKAFANDRHWTVPVKADLPADFSERLLHLLKTPS